MYTFYFILISKSSLLNASDYCTPDPNCAGISQESGWFYTHSNARIADAVGVTSWTKGTYWADNFVPRVSWGAMPPKAGLTGYMDLTRMVGAMGHHTTGNQCFTQSECKARMQTFQQEDFLDETMR